MNDEITIWTQRSTGSGLARRQHVAVLIPAFNEAETIGAVVDAAKRTRLVDDVVVCSDGSTDATAEAAWHARADVVALHHWNRGKGEALATAAAQTPARILITLDADLIGVQPRHIEQLAAPVLDGRADMVSGLFDRGVALNIAAMALPNLSGQRAMTRRVLEAVPAQLARGFRIETGLNGLCSEETACGTTRLRDVDFRRKWQKVGFMRAMGEYVAMHSEVSDARRAGGQGR